MHSRSVNEAYGATNRSFQQSCQQACTGAARFQHLQAEVPCDVDANLTTATLRFRNNERGECTLDWKLTADIAREMTAVPFVSWKWREVEFSVSDNELSRLKGLVFKQPADWTKQLKEEGDALVTAALRALRPQKARPSRRSRARPDKKLTDDGAHLSVGSQTRFERPALNAQRGPLRAEKAHVESVSLHWHGLRGANGSQTGRLFGHPRSAVFKVRLQGFGAGQA